MNVFAIYSVAVSTFYASGTNQYPRSYFEKKDESYDL